MHPKGRLHDITTCTQSITIFMSLRVSIKLVTATKNIKSWRGDQVISDFIMRWFT